MRPTPPCYWCDLHAPRLSDLFVNGHGWCRVCDACLVAIAPAPALPLHRRKVAAA